MIRWKVSQHIFYRSWLAYPESWSSGKPGADLAEDEPSPLRPRSFRTWAEAMDYADKRARTIEVTLPRLTALPTGRHAVLRNGLIIEYTSSGLYPHLRAGHITVEPEERRALAAALLAIAQHKEEA